MAVQPGLCRTWSETPKTGFLGMRLNYLLSLQIVGVSILRAGETMEQALCEVYKNVKLGKILIQTNQETEEPEV